MKRIILICLFVSVSTIGLSQLNAKFENDTITVERDKQNDITVHLPVNIMGTNANNNPTNIIRFDVDATNETTLPINSFVFSTQTISISEGVSQINCQVTILHGNNPGGSTRYISIQLSYNNPLGKTDTAVIKVINKEVKKEEDKQKDSEKSRIMFLNAYNFDFGSTSLTSNYVGHLNLFAPSLSDNKRWGFNTGIMKINYGQKDSTNTGGTTTSENILLSPFDSIKVGLKYLREINAYKTERKNTVWSFYVQPNYELTKKSQQHIYIHAHLELVASKWSATTTAINIKRDTAILGSNFNAAIFRSNIGTNNTYTIHSLSGYFGFGFTFDLKPWDGGSFFFQPTIGITSNTPSLSSVDINTGLSSSTIIKSGNPRTWRSFYLVRANYKHVLSSDATVIVGMDIRGLLPLYSPQYAAYVGLNIGLDSILGLIGGKK